MRKQEEEKKKKEGQTDLHVEFEKQTKFGSCSNRISNIQSPPSIVHLQILKQHFIKRKTDVLIMQASHFTISCRRVYYIQQTEECAVYYYKI
jgi:hypothetical protein